MEFQPNFYNVYEVERVVRFTIVKRTRTTREVAILFTTVDGTAMGMLHARIHKHYCSIMASHQQIQRSM